MAVSTAYVNQILPKDAARVAIPGHVIQVQSNYGVIGGASGTVTLMTVNITPTYSNSKILVLASNGAERNGGGTGDYIFVNVSRTIGSSTIVLGRTFNAMGYQVATNARQYGALNYLDSPNTTNTITYRIVTEPSSSVSWIHYDTALTVMEIAQ